MADLTGRALDAAVAERVMWQEVAIDNETATQYLVWAGTAKRHSLLTHYIDYRYCPYYSTDANAVATVRAEIERRGLVGMFLIELTTAIDPGVTVGPYDRQWAFFNASPEQQCRAALKAVEGAHEAL